MEARYIPVPNASEDFFSFFLNTLKCFYSLTR